MSAHGHVDEVVSGTGVRRHHTITAASRPVARGSIAEETSSIGHDVGGEDVVEDDWVGGAGVVGDKNAGLHRQASLPTSRLYRTVGPGQGRTPKHVPSLNSLSAIAGQQGEEDDYDQDIHNARNQQELELAQEQQQHHAYDDGSSPHTSHFGPGGATVGPPLADTGVRRNQSMTAHGSGGPRRDPAKGGLRRAGTLQTPVAPPRHAAQAGDGVRSPSPTNAEEEYEYQQQYDYEDEEDPYAEDSYVAPTAQQFTGQNVHNGGNNGYGRTPWGPSGNYGGGNDWRQPGGVPDDGSAIDDVQRALSNMELSSGHSQQGSFGSQMGGAGMGLGGPPGYQNQNQGQPVHPPRFNPNQPPPAQYQGGGAGGANLRRTQPVRRTSGSGGGSQGNLQLYTDVPPSGPSGPASASAYPHSRQQSERSEGSSGGGGRERAFSAAGAGGGNWDGQNRNRLGGQSSNPNLKYAYAQQNIPNVPPMPAQYMQGQGQQQPRLGLATNINQAIPGRGPPQGAPGPGVITSPVDVPTLIATKGYNPATFDTQPTFARYFVIKSYTEEDVHKSIKYEIWSSTDPGNKRLDKAFKETAGRGPIYLFFSVNASGHFCGMAEMLTPVDYTRSSTVWASDKWKGVFKVRWIFVRDIPNATLRHIKLNNTQERKPVTNSRDTQELLPDAGHEMLRIFHTHLARTSLLQDFSYYELQSAQKSQMVAPQPPLPQQQQQQQQQQQGQQQQQQGQARMQSPPQTVQQLSPTLQQQHPYAMTNPAALAYANQQQQVVQQQLSPVMNAMGMSPLMQHHPMQMGMNPQYGGMQGALRGPSPGPGSQMPPNAQYMGMQGGF